MGQGDKKERLQHRETLILEILLSGLDARESAKAGAAPMLVYLAELLVKRAREELEEVRRSLDEIAQQASRDA